MGFRGTSGTALSWAFGVRKQRRMAGDHSPSRWNTSSMLLLRLLLLWRRGLRPAPKHADERRGALPTLQGDGHRDVLFASCGTSRLRRRAIPFMERPSLFLALSVDQFLTRVIIIERAWPNKGLTKVCHIWAADFSVPCARLAPCAEAICCCCSSARLESARIVSSRQRRLPSLTCCARRLRSTPCRSTHLLATSAALRRCFDGWQRGEP